MKIGTIFNPNAARAKREPSLAHTLEGVLAPEGPFLVTRSLQDIPQAVEKIVAYNPDILAICGGDGTLYHTLSPFFRLNGTQRLPLIAILKAGTTNTLLKSVGSSDNPVRFAGRIVESIRGKRVFKIVEFDAMKVNDGYGFIAGIAMVARIIRVYLDGGNVGIPKAVSLIFRCLGSALIGGPLIRELSASVRAEGSADGRPIPITSFTFLLVSTASTLGFGMRLIARGHERPGHFHLLASSKSTSYLLWQFIPGILGFPLRGMGHFQGLYRRLDLAFEKPELYMVDGEMFQAGSLTVEAGPRLKIIKG